MSKNYSAPQGSWRNDVKTPDSKNRIISRHDYGPALQGALAWLGDRYLLAEPVPRRREEIKPFFVEPRSWHEAPRAAGPGSRKH